jgi:hypothetical protein
VVFDADLVLQSQSAADVARQFQVAGVDGIGEVETYQGGAAVRRAKSRAMSRVQSTE